MNPEAILIASILGPLVPTVIRDQANGSSDLPPKVFLAIAVFAVLIVAAALAAAWRSERAKRAEFDRVAAGDPDAQMRVVERVRGRSIDWERMYHGTCPKCRKYEFIGHGPLCAKCHLGGAA